MSVKVEKVMSKELIVGYVPGKVEDALEILAKHNVSGIPILKKDTKKVAGVTEVTVRNRYKELTEKLDIVINL